jgi:hypothetical protein
VRVTSPHLDRSQAAARRRACIPYTNDLRKLAEPDGRVKRTPGPGCDKKLTRTDAENTVYGMRCWTNTVSGQVGWAPQMLKRA